MACMHVCVCLCACVCVCVCVCVHCTSQQGRKWKAAYDGAVYMHSLSDEHTDVMHGHKAPHHTHHCLLSGIQPLFHLLLGVLEF